MRDCAALRVWDSLSGQLSRSHREPLKTVSYIYTRRLNASTWWRPQLKQLEEREYLTPRTGQVKELWLDAASVPVVATRCQHRPMPVNHGAKENTDAVYRRSSVLCSL